MDKLFEDFAKLGVQQKVGIFLGALLLVGGGGYYLGLSGTLEKIEANERKLQSQEQDLLKLQQQAQHRSAYMKEVERLKQRLREAEEQLPKKAEVPKLLRDISYEAQQSGLLITKFTVEKEKRKGEFSQVPVKMSVKGSFHEIAVFFDRLSKMSRIVNVAELKMEKPEFINKKIVLQSNFTATTYRFLEEGGRKKKKK